MDIYYNDLNRVLNSLAGYTVLHPVICRNELILLWSNGSVLPRFAVAVGKHPIRCNGEKIEIGV